MKPIKLGPHQISQDDPPFIIAEMSGNHNQSIERALQIVDAAASAGAHAIKIQTYTADTMTIDCDLDLFKINEKDSLWKGYTLYKLYEEAHTPWDWHPKIFDRCREKGILCFSTPFDDTAVDYLEKYDLPCYKIASFENTDIPLLKKVAKTGKPVLMSCGMASREELEESVQVLRTNGCDQIILLKCTSSYPANPKDSNINTIPAMSELFNCHVGLSDHTRGIAVPVASIALGARVIEKHFTLDRSAGGVDSAFSLEPSELKSLVEETKCAFESLGQVRYGATKDEAKSMVFRRSLIITQDMKAGDQFSKENCRTIRPGHGLPPKFYEEILGKRVKTDVKRGTPVSWDIVS